MCVHRERKRKTIIMAKEYNMQKISNYTEQCSHKYMYIRDQNNTSEY